MNKDAERRLQAVYFGGTVFFVVLAWLFRVNLIIGLAVMPAVIRLITAERARRAAHGVAGTPLQAIYRLVAVRELVATGLIVTATWYIARRMAGSPRLWGMEALVVALLVAWALLVRAVFARAKG